jgi:DivIVA domain-containing protein
VVTVLSVLGVLAVLFAAAVVSTRDGQVLGDAPADVADLNLPAGPLQPADVQQVRFGLAVRGYRMSEVDEVLDRLSAEIARRDRRIAELEDAPAGLGRGPAGQPVESPPESPPAWLPLDRPAGGPEAVPGD